RGLGIRAARKFLPRDGLKNESTESTGSTSLLKDFRGLEISPCRARTARRAESCSRRRRRANRRRRAVGRGSWRSGGGFDCQRPGAHSAAGFPSGGKIAFRNSDGSEKAEEGFRYRSGNPRIASKRRHSLRAVVMNPTPAADLLFAARAPEVVGQGLQQVAEG